MLLARGFGYIYVPAESRSRRRRCSCRLCWLKDWWLIQISRVRSGTDTNDLGCGGLAGFEEGCLLFEQLGQLRVRSCWLRRHDRHRFHASHACVSRRSARMHATAVIMKKFSDLGDFGGAVQNRTNNVSELVAESVTSVTSCFHPSPIVLTWRSSRDSKRERRFNRSAAAHDDTHGCTGQDSVRASSLTNPPTLLPH